MKVVSEEPICKIVYGEHVEKNGDDFRHKISKTYVWKYDLKESVVPGDVLKVQTSLGEAFMCVGKIEYFTGKKFCSQHKKVIKHMHRRMKE